MPGTDLSGQQREFRDRLDKIYRESDMLSGGVEYRLGDDGIIRRVPRRRRSLRIGNAVVTFLAVLVLLKAVFVASIDVASYEQRLVVLRAGNSVERAGAVMMRHDPVTDWLARMIGPVGP
jgi:hypothetical protein